jgi:hypothetical protein
MKSKQGVKLNNIIFLSVVFSVLILSTCSKSSAKGSTTDNSKTIGSTTNNEVIMTIKSPDERFVAVIFVRDMGATTKKSYQMSIIEQGKELGNRAGKHICILWYFLCSMGKIS